MSLFCVCYAQSRDPWQQAYSIIDRIDENLNSMQNSNEETQNLLLQLKIVIGMQSDLLTQWEQNWSETQDILRTQELLLQSYEKRLKFWKVFTPVALVAGIAIGAVIANVNVR